MPQPPVPLEECWRRYNAWVAAGKNGSAAAEALGINRQKIRTAINRLVRLGLIEHDKPAPTGMEVRAVAERHDRHGNVTGKSVRYGPEVGGEFEVPAGRSIGRVTAQVGPDGNIEREWIRHNPDDLNPVQVAELVREFAATIPWTRIKPIEAQHKSNDDFLTIYPLADLHLSLKTRKDESGEHYDLETASILFEQKSSELIAKSPEGGTALALYLGDWTHQNDDNNETPRSKHKLEVDAPIFATVRAGVHLAIPFVYRLLKQHDNVIVKVLQGNHDPTSWIGLVVGLSEHFRNEPRVRVDMGEADYWFFRWGVTLLGAHHGHRLKPDQMAGAMATECRKDWGETLYRLFLHGHLHHRIVLDVLGVQVECMRTLAPPDAHHSGKYGSPRSLVSITLHKQEGETARAFVNLRPVLRDAVSFDQVA
jgi:DNA-directed RNA polymerase subunit N (RpoN/RPB10)